MDRPSLDSFLAAAAKALDDAADWAVVPGYSRLGFELRRRRWAVRPAAGELEGRTILVTGASSGIGEALCERLAVAGATVQMAVRSRARGLAARERIASRAGATAAGRLRLETLDVADLDDVARFAAGFAAEHRRLDGLVHNAGVLTDVRRRSRQGHELILATAVLGPLALTNGLAAPLRGGAPSRVVFVSSGGMYTARLTPGDLELEAREFDGPRFYAHAKRGQVELASLLAERWRGSGVSFASVHPGWVDTPGLARSLPRFQRVLRPILRDPGAGADTVAWLLAGDAIACHPGGFWHDRRPRPQHRVPWTRASGADRERFWAELTELVRSPGREESAAGGGR